MTFIEAKNEFDNKYGMVSEYDCFLPEHLTFGRKTNFKKKNGERNEQYYKWQFLYAIVHSGFFIKDYIGTEVQFPKGNKSSAPLKLDAAVFDDISWFEKYKDYHGNGNIESLEWLRKHLLVALEFKKEDNKNIAEVWDKQLKAYLKESQRPFSLGILYDTERLYLFRKHDNVFLRYSEEFNTKGEKSNIKELSLHLPDPSLKWSEKRESLIEQYTAKKDGKLVLKSDKTFSSPSTAADFCIGSSNNGWLVWKDKDGRTLDDVYRQSL